MSNFWQNLLRLGQQTENSSPAQPAIHELIQRTDEEKADYEQWKDSFVLRRLLDWLGDQYAIYRVAPNDVDEALDFLNTPSAQGFVVHFNQTQYSRREATHFFDYLKERVKSFDYRTQISDTRTYNRNDWVETLEKHYLKPRYANRLDGQWDQQFGNILIELEIRNDRVFNLRFRATHYSDRKFLPPQDFKELMQGILS